MVVCADREPVDLSAPSESPGRDGRELLRELYPRTRFDDAGDLPLMQAMWHDDDDTLGVGVFGNGAVVATRQCQPGRKGVGVDRGPAAVGATVLGRRARGRRLP